MKIEMVVGKRRMKILKKKYSMDKLDETFSYASALYNSMRDLTIVNLGSFKVLDTDDDIDRFVFRFNDSMEHETVHKCISDEKKVNKSLGSWYKKRCIMSTVNEEGTVCSMTMELSRGHINYVLFRTVLNKVDDIDKVLRYQDKVILMYKIMYVAMCLVFYIMLFLVSMKNGR